MREIKFRVWDKKNEKIYGGNSQHGGDEPDTGLKTSSAGAWTRLWEALARLSESENHILMQYTGLKDKNGNEIYEGDIVNLGFLAGSIAVKIPEIYHTKREQEHPRRFNEDVVSDWGVIGNVYEDPNLHSLCTKT